MAEFELKALITGVDRLSPALSKMQKRKSGDLNVRRKKRHRVGWRLVAGWQRV